MCQLLTTNKKRSIVEDPTKQAGNRRRAIAELKRRLRGIASDIDRLIDSISVRLSVQNSLSTNRTTYIWEISPERQATTDARIREVVDFWVDTQTNERPARWFFSAYMESAVQPGTADATNNVKL